MNKFSLLTTVALFAYATGNIARAGIITTGDTDTPNVDMFLEIGRAADGTMTINTVGGPSVVSSSHGGGVGRDTGATGIVTIDGAGAAWETGGPGGTGATVRIGGADYLAGARGTGVVNVQNGGALIVDSADLSSFRNSSIFIGERDGSDGTLNVTSGGKVFLTDTTNTATDGVGLTGGRGGKALALVDGPGSEISVVSGIAGGAFFHVGRIADSNAGALDGQLTVSNGGKILVEGNGPDSTFSGFQVARDPGATGLLTIDGGEVELRTGAGAENGKFFHVGREAGTDGELRIENGGVLKTGGEATSFSGNLGRNGGSSGTMVVDGVGSRFEVVDGAGSFTSSLHVGRDETRDLTISNGGVVDLNLGPGASSVSLGQGAGEDG